MRVIAQRVREASVTVDGQITGKIGQGLMLLVGIEAEDSETDLAWMAGKLVRMRVFSDENGVMNRSVQDVGGEILAVSQFTLFASVKKGNRPSWGRRWARCPGRCLHALSNCSRRNSANRCRPVSLEPTCRLP